MEFNSFEDLLSYYKHYVKKCGFGVMTQRSERSENQSVRYVTLGCLQRGKARNKNSNVANPCQTGKMDCGFENLTFFEKDCRNYIDKARYLRLGAVGAGALRDYFMRMQYKNNGFFVLMDLDDDGRLKNVFWADPRSRVAYQYFGDVVTFDTTYLTNRYRMPFALFVGVNHHGQSILLGAGLISREDTETFTWLFQTWSQCMDGIAPKAIIIDQNIAMKNVITIIFPETRHRLCMLHILKKVPEKFESYATYRNGLKTQLMKCVYDTQTIEEFEECWDGFINTYDLHENTWLKSLYAEREH
ncbi:hypothetical protein F2P56_030430 [Juglans regia]|uniref:Protein FAR1-RELATED SEQUENCE n=2 Tax=Juglans regia TaxID=51240 RepID=A0A833TZT8_JUGRE|nr:protein FAR1-RELATED SEQUENCE 4-like [Juglans regia]KAF5450049.1 hypothetical protein F2P56_030430 [Juglans regia]